MAGLPVDAITGNYDAFSDEGLSPDDAIAETLDCYPEAGLDTIKAILSYRAAGLRHGVFSAARRIAPAGNGNLCV